MYEIDLKQCFPNIQGEYVTEELLKMGVPRGYCCYLEEINRSTPNPITEDQIEKQKQNEELMGKPWEYHDEFEGEKTGTSEQLRGFPQGANTSPILTELVLDK